MKTTCCFIMGFATLGMSVLSAAADSVREDELDAPVDVLRAECDQSVYLLTRYPAAYGTADPALKGLTYSAIGWSREATPDATRTVTVTAQSGTMTGGVFTSDGSDAVTVLAETTGVGTFDLDPSDLDQKFYRFTHTVKDDGVVDDDATLYGYVDLSDLERTATQAEVAGAALVPFTHPIELGQDAGSPWQPVDYTRSGTGIVTDGALAKDAVTETTFDIRDAGTFSYQYLLTGGTLEVLVDGVLLETPTAQTWTSDAIAIEEYGAHRITLRYTASGDGAVAKIRNVHWQEPETAARNSSAGDGRVDLRSSPRQILRREWVLPFQYSATNWTGLTTAAADPKSAVSIVRLKGSDSAALTTWTEEPKKRRDLLPPTAGEGETRWNTAAGVWKATHYLIDGATTNATESAIFDVRETLSGTRILAR